MVWLRNKYGGWFEIPDEDYIPSKNEDLKEKQIAKTKEEAGKLNSKNKDIANTGIDKDTGTVDSNWKINDKMSPELSKRLDELEKGDEPIGKFWNGDAELSKIYEQLKNIKDFEFTKQTLSIFHDYHRFYNDGDLPGWARSYNADFTKWDNRWNIRTLNGHGELELERRANAALIKELKRYRKKNKFN